MKQIVNSNINLEQVIHTVLSLAQKKGATAAEASILKSTGLNVTVRLGEVETIEHHQDKEVDITVYFNKKIAHVTSSDITEQALQMAVEKACNVAKFTQEDPAVGLADKTLLAVNYPNLDLFHPWNISKDQAIKLAIECETIARSADKRIINSEGATLNTLDSWYCYGNTEDFMGSYATSYHSLSCALVASDGHEMQRDHDYTVARDPQDLLDPAALANSVAEKTVKRLGARKIPTQQAPIIFSAELARGFIGHFINAITGNNIYRRSSFLLDQLQQKIFPDFLNIQEQPHLLKTLGSAPFDSEGVQTKTKDLIKEGIVQTYLLGSYSARKLGMQSTGNAGGAHNVTVLTPGMPLSELLKKMGTGLLVTELIGQGVNMVTGDYSRGAFGYWVEQGEIQYPVQEITIAGNLKDMFRNLIAVGNDIDRRGNIITGSLLIADMMLAGH